MAEEENGDPFKEFGGTPISPADGDPFAAFGGKTIKKKVVSDSSPTTSPTSRIGSGNPLLSKQNNDFNFAEASNPELQKEYNKQTKAKSSALSNRLKDLNSVYDSAQGKGASNHIAKAAIQAPEDKITDEATVDALPYDGRALNVAKGLNTAYEGLLKIPRFVYGVAAVPQNFLADKLDMPSLAADYDSFLKNTDVNVNGVPLSPLTALDQLGDYYKGEAQRYGEKTRKFDDNITSSISKGNWANAGNQILDQIAESAPSIAMMAMTSGAGNAAKLGEVSKTLVNALPFMSQQNAALQDDKTIPEWLKPINAGLNGLSEVIFDQSFGTQAAIQGIVNRFNNEGRELAVEGAKEFASSFLNGVLKGAKVIKPFAMGAIEEGTTQLAQNIVDKYTINPDKDLMENVTDAMLVGAAMTGGITTAGEIIQPKQKARVTEIKAQQQSLLNELGNPNLTEEARTGVEQILDDHQKEIDTISKESKDLVDSLSPAQKTDVENISKKISTAENLIADPNTSEEVKAVAQKQVDALGKEIDAIKPEAVVSATPEVPNKSVQDIESRREKSLSERQSFVDDLRKNPTNKFKLKDGNEVEMSLRSSDQTELNDSNVKDAKEFTVDVKQDGKVVGAAVFKVDPKDGKAYANSIRVNDGHRRKGVASNIYDYVEGLGFDVKPSDKRVTDGRRLWEGMNTSSAINERFDREIQDLNPKEKTDEVTEEEYMDFVSKGIVSKERINSIANKLANNEKLTREEGFIFKAKESEINKQIETKPIENEVEQPLPTQENVVTESVSPERTKEVLTKAEDDLKALKQVANKTLKHEASLKRLTEAKNKGEISQQEFTDLKNRFDDVLADSAPKIKAENLTPEEKTTFEQEFKADNLTHDDFIKHENRQLNEETGTDAETVQPTGDDRTGDVAENRGSETIQEPIGETEDGGKLTSLKNAEVAKKRADYGFDERQPVEKVTNKETEALADAEIAKGYDVRELIDRVKQNKPITAKETVILAKYQGVLQEKLIDINTRTEANIDATPGSFERLVEERNKTLDELLETYDASERSGTETARALQVRRLKVLEDYSLANLFIRKRQALGGVELSEAQKNEVVEVYRKLKESEDAFNAKIAALEEENSKLKAQGATERMKREVNADKRRNKRATTKDALKKERSEILDEMSKIARKSLGRLSANPIPAEMIPLIGRLAKNYFIDGVTSIDQIVDNIHGQVRDYVDGVTKRDVRDAISGYGLDERPTRDDLRQNIQDLKTQARLISQIEDAEAGIKREKSEVKRNAASEEVETLRARLKDLTKSDDALAAMKTRVKNQIIDIQKRLEVQDYSKKEKTTYELDDAARKLQDAYRKVKWDFELALQKDILANRTKRQKAYDDMVSITSIPRAIMSTGDFSAPLRQSVVFTVSHPNVAVRAFGEALRHWRNPAVANRWLADLKESEGYQLMLQSKLYLSDRTDARVAAKEEEFMSNLADKIPILGAGFEYRGVKIGEVNIGGKKVGNFDLIGKSERHYVGYLNKMRVDMFTRGVDLLQDQGITYAANPDAYKALATFINAGTGRGDLPGVLKTAAPVLNSTLFSPRLIASRLQLLAPIWLRNAPKPVRNMYFNDMAKFVGVGLTVLALSKIGGADVEDDPRSPDFGKIRVGDTRWDIWGGFQQYIRFFAQEISGQKKSSASGNITPLDGTSYNKATKLSVLGDFLRGKLAPIPSFAMDAISGSTMVGQPFSPMESIPKMLEPLVSQGIRESAKSDGWAFALTATGIPSILGVGVQTYGVNNFLSKGVDDKTIELLKSKKAVAIEPKEGDKEIYDVNTGKDRSMTSAEFKKYYDVWSGYIKSDLKEKHDIYKAMSVEEFETTFRSMKMKASKLAKATVSGVAEGDTYIEFNDAKYELTPEQVKERKAYIDEFLKDNGTELSESFKEANENVEGKKKLTDADIQIKVRSLASKYSKGKILEKYLDGDELNLNKKE